MREAMAVFTIIAVIAILLVEWRVMKRKRTIEKVVFITILAVSIALSLTDLPRMYGPPELYIELFRPFRFLIE